MYLTRFSTSIFRLLQALLSAYSEAFPNHLVFTGAVKEGRTDNVQSQTMPHDHSKKIAEFYWACWGSYLGLELLNLGQVGFYLFVYFRQDSQRLFSGVRHSLWHPARPSPTTLSTPVRARTFPSSSATMLGQTILTYSCSTSQLLLCRGVPAHHRTKDPSTTLNHWYLITVEPLLFSI